MIEYFLFPVENKKILYAYKKSDVCQIVMFILL
jgi:hypothetical protein